MTRLPSLSLPSAPRNLAVAIIFLVSIFCCLPSKAASDLEAEMMNPPQMDAPTPVKVDIYFDDLTDISVVRNSFRVTAQMVLQWADPRLARLFNPKDPDTRNLEGPAAEALLARLWHPEVEIMNECGQRRASARALRISRDGRATLYEKFDTEAHLHGDMYFFPFATAQLRLAISTIMQDEKFLLLVPDVFAAQAGLKMDDIITGPWRFERLETKVSTTLRSHEPELGYSLLECNIMARRDLLSGLGFFHPPDFADLGHRLRTPLD